MSVENPLWAYIFHPPQAKKSLFNLLKELPVFNDLSLHQLRQISRILHERHYSKGEIIFNEDEPGAGMYIIKQGEVVITKRSESDEPIELAVFKERNFFGELALLDEMPRSAAAATRTETILLGFSKPDLENLIERNPRLGVKILGNLSKLISQRLLMANDTIEDMQDRLRRINQSNKKKADK